MLWVFILVGTAGFVLMVPEIMRALDGLTSDAVAGAIGFGGTAFGIVGIALQQFDMGAGSALVASLALAGAVAAIHPEILNLVRGGPSPAPVSQPLSGDDD